MPSNTQIRAADAGEGFGDWLRRVRLSRGLKVVEAAKLCGISEGTWAKLENEQHIRIELHTLLAVSDGLGIEIGYMLHKMGVLEGREAVNLRRLDRAQTIADAVARFDDAARAGLAEALNALSDDPVDFDRDKALMEMRSALTLLDLIVSRLKSDGWLDPEPVTDGRDRKYWSRADFDFLQANAELSHVDMAKALGRTVNSVRQKRAILANKQSREPK